MRLSFATTLVVLPVLASALPHELRPSIPLTKRPHLNKRGGTVDIDFLRKHMAYVEGKIHRGLQTYQRNTANHLAAVAPATSRKRDGDGDIASNPLVDDNQVLWHGKISVGTPPVEYTVDFDTGSSDLFLPASDCKTNCDGHTRYDPSKSSSSKALDKDFTLQYGDGSNVSGKQFADSVTIAGLNATNQTLGAASQYSEGFASPGFPADGLMGMGYQTISEYDAPPFFQSLVEQKKVKEPVFAFKLAKNGSELTLGGLNSKLYKGDFTYAAVTKKGYWQVKMDAVSINDEQVAKDASSIIDTGTTLIIGPKDGVDTFYKSIPGSRDASQELGPGIYTVPCNTIDTVKASLTFSGKTFNIDPSTFNLGPAKEGAQDCVGGVGTANVGSIGWIIGDVFLQNVYTAFDLGKDQVGFASLA